LSSDDTGSFELDLNDAGVAVVQSWIMNPEGNFGLIIKNYSSATNRQSIRSSETSNDNQRPKLSLTYELPVNSAPTVVAGSDQTVPETEEVQLSGSVTDDGLPDPSNITIDWSVVSGPGNVVFADSTATNTTANFDTDGTYVLRLTANDGSFVSFDDIEIVVEPAVATHSDLELDVELQSLTAAGNDQLTVTYEVLSISGPFDIAIVRSDDASFDGADELQGTITLTDLEDQSIGIHTKTFTIGTGAGEFSLPGYGSSETDSNYYLLGVAVPHNSLINAETVSINEQQIDLFDGIYHANGGDIFVHGSEGTDSITVQEHSIQVNLGNGVLLYDTSAFANLRVRGHGGNDILDADLNSKIDLFFHGGPGNDQAFIYGTDANETASLRPGSLEMTGLSNVRAISTEQIRVFGNGGVNSASMFDSSGDDKFVSKPSYSLLKGNGFVNYLKGFSNIDATADAGGYDVAKLYDGTGNDSLEAQPTIATLHGENNGFRTTARDFEKVDARAVNGGEDTVTFSDSPGDDFLLATSTFSKMSGPGFLNQTIGFEKTIANSNAGGNDKAKLVGTTGNEVFVAHPTTSQFQGLELDITANGFNQVEALGRGGDNDRAELYDSTGNDTFIATSVWARLLGTNFQNIARDFDQVEAFASTGYDRGKLYDSAGSDLYEGRPDRATLSGAGFKNIAHQFERIDVFAKQGGIDHAKLYDSVGNDTYYSTKVIGLLLGSNFKHYLRNAIESVEIIGGAGGDDLVNATDIQTLDTVFGFQNLFSLNRTGGRSEDVTEFGTVHATSAATDANDDGPIANVNNLDYVFEKIGKWSQ